MKQPLGLFARIASKQNETKTSLACGWRRRRDAGVRPAVPELHLNGRHRTSHAGGAAARLAAAQPRHCLSRHGVRTARSESDGIRYREEAGCTFGAPRMRSIRATPSNHALQRNAAGRRSLQSVRLVRGASKLGSFGRPGNIFRAAASKYQACRAAQCRSANLGNTKRSP